MTFFRIEDKNRFHHLGSHHLNKSILGKVLPGRGLGGSTRFHTSTLFTKGDKKAIKIGFHKTHRGHETFKKYIFLI